MALSAQREEMRRREEQQRETIREGQAARREAEAPTVSLPAVGLTNTSVEAVPKRRKRDRLDPRKVRIGGKTFWQIQLGSEIRDGRRIRLRRTFRDLKEAQTYSDLKRIERRNHGAFSISLSEKLRSDATEAAKLLVPYQVDLLDVVREYVRRRHPIHVRPTSPVGGIESAGRRSASQGRSGLAGDTHRRTGRAVVGERRRNNAAIPCLRALRWLARRRVATFIMGASRFRARPDRGDSKVE